MSKQIILTEAEMLNRQLYIGLWCPVVITSQKKAILGLFFSHVSTISHSDCKLQPAWYKEARKEGANGDIDLQLGIVAAGMRNS